MNADRRRAGVFFTEKEELILFPFVSFSPNSILAYLIVLWSGLMRYFQRQMERHLRLLEQENIWGPRPF